MVAALLPVLAGTARAAGPDVFINELHYDNAGTDTGEGFEIAGPVGTSLAGWTVVLYNGSNNMSYNTIALSGIIPDQQAGFGTLAFSLPTNGLQNGSPDGLALVDAGSTVVEFLSYEGSFTAGNGPANGMISTDIGVSEGSSTPAGESLQLTGTGTMGGDFTWSGPAPDSPGAVNSGQIFGQPVVVSCPSVLLLLPGDTATVQLTATDADDQATWDAITVTPAEPGIITSIAGVPGEDGQTAGAEVNVASTVGVGTYTVEGTAVSTDGSTASCSFDIHVLGITPIHDVQGPGDSSPIEGEFVAVEGVVVGDFQGFEQIGGFFLMEESEDQDTLTTTSEGIAVFDFTPVDVGDVAVVYGEVVEFDGETQIDTDLGGVRVVGSSNEDLVQPVYLPVTAIDDFEWYEGMLVTFPQDLYISEYFNYDRFGEIVLATSRQFQPTEIMEPGSDAAALADEQALARITLDDGQRFQNPDFNRHPNGEEFTLDNTFRGGDILVDVTGVMDFNFGDHVIQPTTGATYIPANPRPTKDAKVKGQIRVASFNVLNFFTTIDQGPDVCGPTVMSDCRGADSEEEYERQLAKLLAGIQALNADVIGFQEVENDIFDDDGSRAHDAILTIVDELNAIPGAGHWAWVGEPRDQNGVVYFNDYPIRNEIIYRTTSVKPVGPAQTIRGTGCEVFTPVVSCAFDLLRGEDFEPVGRPPIAQTFAKAAAGAPNKVFTVVNNHFKSKGSDCDDIADPDLDDGQANCNLTRVAQSEALMDFVADLQDWSGDDDVLLLGDFNSYGMEDPLGVIKGEGYDDLLTTYEGLYSYGYVFDGRFGSLDHAFASPSLASQVRGAVSYHINADEPDILDYDTSFKSDSQIALYEPLPYRTSDHDPLVVGLSINNEQGN